jgi:glucose-6-phosphate isomerase
MQLPDETISYDYEAALAPYSQIWSPGQELRSQNLIDPRRLKALVPQIMEVRGQVAAERGMKDIPPEMLPLDSGFIDLPQTYLDAYRRRGEESDLGRIIARAAQLRADVDRVVILGIGGSYMGARALFEALRSSYHNELKPESRMSIPRIYFEGNNFDNDAFNELVDLLQTGCIDPGIRAERWGVIVISKSGGTLENAVAYRVFCRETTDFYGSNPDLLHSVVVPITGATGKLRELLVADGYDDDEIFSIPDNIGGRYSVLTPVGLVPAAVMGLDVRALLLGAALISRRFLEEPFERNPVLQYAAINYLMSSELNKNIRVLAVWSKKLEALGLWYDQLLSESLGKQGRGPTPLTVVETRDLHSRGQQHQDGTRDKMINNLIVKSWRSSPIPIGMSDRNEDELNPLARKTLPELLDAAHHGTVQAYADVARPTANITLPSISEHTMGQLLQMLMLATVVEGRLLGINPYGQPGVEAYKRNMRNQLRK